MALLKPKTQARGVQLNVRIPPALHDELLALRADADAAGLAFDANEVLAKALAQALRAARAELPQGDAGRPAGGRADEAQRASLGASSLLAQR